MCVDFGGRCERGLRSATRLMGEVGVAVTA